MDTETLFALKTRTREQMQKDGILPGGRVPSHTSPEDLEGHFFEINPSFGMLTHELEANNSGFHNHSHFEMCYVVSGECVQKLEDGETVTLHKGNMVILNPLAMHSCSISGIQDNVIVFTIKPNIFNTAFFSFFEAENYISDFFINYIMSKSTKNYMVFYNRYNEETDSLVERLVNTYLKQGPFMTTELKCLLVLLFAQLLQHHPEEIPEEEQDKFAEIVNFMSRHLQSVTLQDVAAHFHFHPNYLSTYIKKQSGRTFSNILLELRLMQAKYYLSSTDLPVSHIAQLLGYQDQPSFNAMFKKNVGSTPSEFRKFNMEK